MPEVIPLKDVTASPWNIGLIYCAIRLEISKSIGLYGSFAMRCCGHYDSLLNYTPFFYESAESL